VANVAAAIALAESGGNAGITNSIGAAGLWQIYGLPFPGNPLDPMTNARMAVAKYKGAGGFTPWTTYTGADTGPGGGPGPKTYLRYLARGGVIHRLQGGGLGSRSSFNPGSLQTGPAKGVNTPLIPSYSISNGSLAVSGYTFAGGALPSASTNDNTQALEDNTAALQAQNDLLAEQNDLLTQQRDDARRALNASEANYGTILKGLVDFMSGQIGGRVGLGFQSPGFAGGSARY
jgi:hypothetical protein